MTGDVYQITLDDAHLQYLTGEKGETGLSWSLPAMMAVFEHDKPRSVPFWKTMRLVILNIIQKRMKNVKTGR